MSNLAVKAVQQRIEQLEADVKHTEELVAVLKEDNPDHPIFTGFSNTSEHLIVPSTNAVTEDRDREIMLKAFEEILEYRKDRLLFAKTDMPKLLELASELDKRM